MLSKCKDPFLPLATICQINRSINQLVTFRLGLSHNMAIRVNNAAPGDQGAVVFLSGLTRMYTETCIRVASVLVGEVVVEEGFFFLPLV